MPNSVHGGGVAHSVSASGIVAQAVKGSHVLKIDGCCRFKGGVTFQVGAETFAAHRAVLAARSPVFMAQLFGQMKETITSHVRVDDMEPRVFRAMLHLVYTDSLPEMDSGGDAQAMAQHVLVGADKYGMERLKLICEDRLCNYINSGTAATTLELAEQYGFRELKEACFKFLKTPGILKAVMDSNEFQRLTTRCPGAASCSPTWHPDPSSISETEN